MSQLAIHGLAGDAGDFIRFGFGGVVATTPDTFVPGGGGGGGGTGAYVPGKFPGIKEPARKREAPAWNIRNARATVFVRASGSLEFIETFTTLSIDSDAPAFLNLAATGNLIHIDRHANDAEARLILMALGMQ